MLVNMKYHLVTIMALFITLAIGILIGSTIIGNGSISEQQQKLISDLKDDFKTLRTENQRFKGEIDRLEEQLAVNLKYRKKVLSFLFKDRLKGEKLLVITGDNIEKRITTKVINYLKLANPGVIKILKENDLEQGKYNKIIVLGRTNKEIKQQYFNKNAEIIRLSQVELNSFSQTVDKLMKIVGQTTSNLSKEGR
ncbi:copper transporter [Halanaerobacter jeridensis]|uniref:Copper transport outer membrane protein MctB n=1 Tax=Halanaerobacter jeridensis TaxID=706427 RepID=A0A938XQ55_9FIRM|nr:copper transporter [Halanaerobacter jeridensis]MBM7555250.1 hypothetical protein [Halanaerobacter jeridensis]